MGGTSEGERGGGLAREKGGRVERIGIGTRNMEGGWIGSGLKGERSVGGRGRRFGRNEMGRRSGPTSFILNSLKTKFQTVEIFDELCFWGLTCLVFLLGGEERRINRRGN